MTAEEIIGLLHLVPHPEGGYFAETYRSNESIACGHLPSRYTGDRAFGTAIYYLLTPGSFSSIHGWRATRCSISISGHRSRWCSFSRMEVMKCC